LTLPFFNFPKPDKIKGMREILTKSQQETSRIAKLLAQEIKRKPLTNKKALIIGLEGELGSGKTTFIKAVAKGLGIKRRLTSPSFVLMKKYRNFYHIDCYRIKNYKDILALDFQEIVSNPQNIILIEWAERIRKILPKDAIRIRFKILSERQRRVIISNYSN